MSNEEKQYLVTFRVSGPVQNVAKWLEGNSGIADLVRIEEEDRDA